MADRNEVARIREEHEEYEQMFCKGVTMFYRGTADPAPRRKLMAKADYQCCASCNAKIVYSPDDQSDGVLCGTCATDLRARLTDAEDALVAEPRVSVADAVLSICGRLHEEQAKQEKRLDGMERSTEVLPEILAAQRERATTLQTALDIVNEQEGWSGSELGILQRKLQDAEAHIGRMTDLLQRVTDEYIGHGEEPESLDEAPTLLASSPTSSGKAWRAMVSELEELKREQHN